MCCRKDYRLSIYFLSECTQLRFVQLFNKALLLYYYYYLLTYAACMSQTRESALQSRTTGPALQLGNITSQSATLNSHSVTHTWWVSTFYHPIEGRPTNSKFYYQD